MQELTAQEQELLDDLREDAKEYQGHYLDLEEVRVLVALIERLRSAGA